MAPRKITGVITIPADQQDDLAPTDEGTDFEAFLSEIGLDGATSVRVERKETEGPDVGKWGFCTKWQASGSILEDIQREFGPGSYRLRYTDVNTGKIKGQKVVLVKAPLSYSANGAAATGGAPSDRRLDLLERLLEGLVTRPQAAPENPLDNLVKMAEVMSKLVPKESGNASEKSLDLYLRGLEHGRKQAETIAAIASSGGEGDALLRIGLPLVELAKSQMDLNQRQAAAAPAVPPPLVPGHNPQSEQVDMPWWYLALRPYVGDLLKRAQMGKNARVYAAAVLEDMPDSVLPRISQLVADPDFMRQFCTVFPGFNETVELQAWVSAFIDEIRLSIVEDEELSELDAESAVVSGNGAVANG
jgi:hypothetical protein